MKKILCLLLCLMLLLPLAAAKAEMLPVENETPVYPMMTVEDEEPLAVEAAGTYYYNTYKTVQTNKEYTFGHNENSGLYSWYVLWSTNGSSWTTITGNSFNDVNYRSSSFSLRANYRDLGAYITFYTTGTFFIRVITTSRDSYTDTIETYCFTVEQGIQPSLSVTPSSVSLAGGGSKQLSLSGSYVESYDFYSSNPKVASLTYNNGSLVLEAWNTGTATIRFTGYGSYGNASASCQVTVTGSSVAKPIFYCGAAPIPAQAYTGSQIRPGVTVKDDKTTLTEGVDYTLSYANNINVGTATVTVTGIGAYTGQGKVDFTILPSVSGATVTLSGASGLVYDGQAKKPTAKVTLDGKTLVEGTDYTVSYKNNTNAGKATVVITGIGQYAGTAEKTFSIAKAAQTLSLSIPSSKIMIGKAETVSVSGAKTALSYTSSNTSVAAVDSSGKVSAIAVGTATITVRAEESANYSAAKATLKITSVLNPIENCTIAEIERQVYSGKAVRPKLVIKNGNTTLSEGVDYKLSYQNNTAPGTATVTVTGMGIYTGSQAMEFIIVKDISKTKISLSGASGLVYDGTVKKPIPVITLDGKTLTEGTDYSVSYQDNIHAGTAKAVITGIGAFGGSVEKNFTIAKATQTLSLSISSPRIAVNENATISVSGAHTSLTYTSSNTNIATVSSYGIVSGRLQGTVTILVQAVETADYWPAEASLSVQIAKLWGYCGDTLEGVIWTWNSNTRELVISPNGSGNTQMRSYSKYQNTPWYDNDIDGMIQKVTIEPGVSGIENAFDAYYLAYWDPDYNGMNRKRHHPGNDWNHNGYYEERPGLMSLSSVTIPGTVTYIGTNAFNKCASLSEVILSEGLKSIYSSAFAKCTSLTSIAIPKSVTYISSSAFSDCTKLTDVWYRGSEAEWKAMNVTLPSSARIHYMESNALQLPESLQVIESGALEGIAAEVIYIPASVKVIQYDAFANCRNLKTLVFDGSPSSIADDMLAGCTGVTIRARKNTTAASWATARGIPVSYY